MGIVEFVLQRAKNEGELIGIEKGIEKGMEKGIEKGIQKGMEIKETEDNIRFVKSLLVQTDFTVQRIAQIADVPVAFVEQVKASLSNMAN